MLDLGGEPDCGQKNDGGKEDHDQAEPVHTEGETQAQIGGNRERVHILKRTGSRLKAKILDHRE